MIKYFSLVRFTLLGRIILGVLLISFGIDLSDIDVNSSLTHVIVPQSIFDFTILIICIVWPAVTSVMLILLMAQLLLTKDSANIPIF